MSPHEGGGDDDDDETTLLLSALPSSLRLPQPPSSGLAAAYGLLLVARQLSPPLAKGREPLSRRRRRELGSAFRGREGN